MKKLVALVVLSAVIISSFIPLAFHNEKLQYNDKKNTPFYNKLVEYAKSQGKTVDELISNWTAEDWLEWYRWEGNPIAGSTNITDQLLSTDWVHLSNFGNITWGADYDYEYKYNATSDRLEMWHNGTLVSYLDSDDLWHYVSDRPNFTDIHHIIDKEYVDFAVASLGARYYMINTSSGISDYKLTQLSPPSGSEESITKTGLTDDEYIARWISPSPNEPSKLIKGVYNWHIYAEKTGGTKTLRLYWKLVERKSDNSEVIIATSVASNEIVSSKNYYVLPLFLDEDYTLDDGSYIVGKIYADISGGGSSPGVTIYFNGDTQSHWEIPVNLEIFSNTFLKLNGSNANSDIDVSPYNFTAGNISAFNLKSPYSYIVWRNGSTYYARNGTTGEIEFKSTNATATIQYAINSLPDSGGKIFIKAGTYVIDSTIWVNKSNISICGEGSSTILSGSSSLNNAIMTVRKDASTSDWLHNIEIAHLTFDGTNMPRTTYDSILKALHGRYVERLNVHNLIVKNTPATGIGIDQIKYSWIHHNYIEGCGTSGEAAGGNGIGIGVASDYNIISDNIIYDVANNGILVEAFGYAHYYIISNNEVLYCDGAGVRLDGIAQFLITDNILYHNKNGIQISKIEWASSTVYSQQGLITDNLIYYSNTHGIRIPYSSSKQIYIEHNWIKLSQHYGIYTNTDDDVYIVGNIFVLNTDGAISTGTGINPVIEDNIGYTTENSGSAEITGDGSTTSFTISHGLSTTPSIVLITPTNQSMASATWWVSAKSSTTFTITFTTAPSSGTKLSFDWYAEV